MTYPYRHAHPDLDEKPVISFTHPIRLALWMLAWDAALIGLGLLLWRLCR